MPSSPHEQRKLEHLRICLEEDITGRPSGTGFDSYRFVHQALPEIDLAAVDTSTTFLGKRLRAPFLISSMTGGTDAAHAINCNLAAAAQLHGVAMSVGSQRTGIEHPELAYSYQVREVAPDILLCANLGAVQLNYGYGLEQCLRAVEMIQADVLILHLNPLQEALQPNGNTNFAGLVERIAEIRAALPVPVIVKEVGWGISERVAHLLLAAGVAAIDVGGAGGTSWSQVEKHRAAGVLERAVGETFIAWGIPTPESLQQVRRVAPELPLVGSGGVRSGIDAAKALALGAHLVGLAAPFLRAATESAEAVGATVQQLVAELRIAMFGIGARDLGELRDTPWLQRVR